MQSKEAPKLMANVTKSRQNIQGTDLEGEDEKVGWG